MRSSRISPFTRQMRARFKFLVSFLKKDWRLNDYPIIFRRQDEGPFSGPERLRPSPWVASIVNWHLTGTGSSKKAALDSLKSNFENFQATGKPLPRPGTRVPIEFASDEKVSRFPSLRDDFIHQVLDLPWAFLSDESCLWDFHEFESNDELNRKILAIYGVDVSDIQDGNMAAILERIAASNCH